MHQICCSTLQKRCFFHLSWRTTRFNNIFLANPCSTKNLQSITNMRILCNSEQRSERRHTKSKGTTSCGDLPHLTENKGYQTSVIDHTSIQDQRVHCCTKHVAVRYQKGFHCVDLVEIQLITAEQQHVQNPREYCTFRTDIISGTCTFQIPRKKARNSIDKVAGKYHKLLLNKTICC